MSLDTMEAVDTIAVYLPELGLVSFDGRKYTPVVARLVAEMLAFLTQEPSPMPERVDKNIDQAEHDRVETIRAAVAGEEVAREALAKFLATSQLPVAGPVLRDTAGEIHRTGHRATTLFI